MAWMGVLESKVSQTPNINAHKQSNKHQTTTVTWWSFDFSRWRPSAILDLFSTLLDHPRCIFGGLSAAQNLVGIHAVVSMIWTFEYFVRLAWKCLSCPQSNGRTKHPTLPLSLGAHGFPSNPPVLRPTSVITPNNSSIGSRTTAQLCNKFLTPKTAPSLRWSPLPFNTPILRLTPLTIPNGRWIQSAILPQYTFWTDRLTNWSTDWWDKWQTWTMGVYALLIESDALIIITSTVCYFSSIIITVTDYGRVNEKWVS